MQLTIHGEKTFSSATLWSSISMIRVDSEQLSIFPLSLDLDLKKTFGYLQMRFPAVNILYIQRYVIISITSLVKIFISF